jgi:3-oxoacyl-[acyl-carrier-protein] synthase-3
VSGAAILGLGEHRPARLVTNDELSQTLDTSDEWIRERTGFRTRGIAAADETVVAMATSAAGKALADAGRSPESVDLVVLATCSMASSIPGGAALIASALGAPTPAAFDLNAGCSGFCYALAVAADLVRAGRSRTALVVGSERLSDWTDWSDRSTAILFGDGAGAAVVGASDLDGIGPVEWGSDGTLAELVYAPTDTRLLTMQGPPLYRWATRMLPGVAEAACARAGLAPADLAAIVCHQANLRMIDAVVRALRLPPSVVVARDGATTGNTSAASVPLALSALRDTGAVASGARVLLLGFGAGLTYAAQVVAVP